MADEANPLIERDTDDEKPIGFWEWSGSLLDDLLSFGSGGGQETGNRGPVGCSSNRPMIDGGTLVRGQCQPPGMKRPVLRLDPIEISPIRPLDKVKKSEDFESKFKIGEAVYWELGLAGQITEKFLEFPYRTGKIKFKSGKLEGKGLVCSSFAKIFGALWFSGDATKQEKPVEHTVRARVRPRLSREGGKKWKVVTKVKGKEKILSESDDEDKARELARLRTLSKDTGKTVSSAQIYAAEHDGSLVNVRRLRLNKLIEDFLDKRKLYAVVKYGTKDTDSREHVLFLIFVKSLDEWVVIHSTGWARKKGGRGPGPGIYRMPRNKKGKYKSTKFYQAWDWGPAYRPRNPDIDRWEFVP